MSETLIEAKNLKKYFPVQNFFGGNKHFVKAVDDVSLTIQQGETFGLVGESGCGKSTLGRTIIRMYDVTEGDILFHGVNIARLKRKQLGEYHKKMQIIFQDPYSALNPSMNVGEIISEPLLLNRDLSPKDREDKIVSLLERVGMKKDDIGKFPYEFSGGQRQRIGIARALSTDPEFILCDEPISALDVSIQAQVINLLEDCQKKSGVSYLFVAHDLSMVRHISQHIGVMYLGSLVECGDCSEVYDHPLHPYTQALLSAIPIPDPQKARNSSRQIIKGSLPSPMDIPSGCRFHTRCPYAKKICCEQAPAFRQVAEGHEVACHLF